MTLGSLIATIAALAIGLARADVVILTVGSAGDFCGEYDPSWQPLTRSPAAFTAALVEPLLGCVNNSAPNVTNPSALAGHAAVFLRGDCFFATKAKIAYSSGAAAVVIVDNPGGAMTAPISTNSSDYALTPIPVVMVTSDALAALTTGAAITLRVATAPFLDLNSAVFLILAVAVVTAGSWWSTADERAHLHKPAPANTQQQQQQKSEADSENGAEKKDSKANTFSVYQVAIFLVSASLFLVAMFYWYKYLIYVAIGVFCLMGALAISTVADELLAKANLSQARVSLPYFGTTLWTSVATGLLGVVVGVWFGICRHASYAWVLQDFMGVCLMLTVISTMKLPDLKVATLLLLVFLCYDVFFVFITPFLTKNHQSVMVNAATGGQSSTETLPFLIVLPRFLASKCTGGMSMLGFGDVILPALLVSYTLAFDVLVLQHGPTQPRAARLWRRYPYWVGGVCAYALGLAVTFLMLAATRMAQPALLYLVPFTLGATWVQGWWKGHLRGLLTGRLPVSLLQYQTGASAGGADEDSGSARPVRSGSDGGDDSADEDTKLLISS